MISWISGEIVTSWQISNKYYFLINCQGLGYEVQIQESTFNNYNNLKNSDNKIKLWLKHIKKEDYDLLFGFMSKEEKDFFTEILNIKGIGSQIGMSLFNKFTLNEIIEAISEDNKNLISSVQGIGHKMTERIILELKNNILLSKSRKEINDNKKFLQNNNEIKSIFYDLEITLNSLNYPKKDIKNMFNVLIKDIDKKKKTDNDLQLNMTFEDLLKDAMNYLDHKK